MKTFLLSRVVTDLVEIPEDIEPTTNEIVSYLTNNSKLPPLSEENVEDYTAVEAG